MWGIAAGNQRAVIEQQLSLVAGKRYVFSVDCAAVGNGDDADRVVLNIIPFTSVTLLSPRPTIGELAPGGRPFGCIVSGNAKLRIGPELGSGSADITLERPMLDEGTALRDYAATDPSMSASALDWDFVPNRGYYDGAVTKVASAIISQRIRAGYFGWRMTMRRPGSLRHVQFQIASNRTGETSKSRVNGNNSHAFPASWKLGLRIFNANSDWRINGDALRDIQWIYTNPSGGGDESRVLFELDIADLAVATGQRLLFLIYSRESNPENNHPSVNMVMNGGRPSLGLNPPRAVSILWGDDPLHVRGSSLSPGSNGELFGLGLRYADGYEEGDVGHDATPSAFRTDIGGSNRVRQRWSSPYWRRAARLALAVYRRPNLMPQSDLTVRISGPDISAMNLTIPASQIQIFDEAIRSSYSFTHQIFNLPGELLMSPNSVYSIELFSPNSGDDRYRIHGFRHYKDGLARASVSTIYPVSEMTPIEPHRWSGLAEKSSNGGGVWSPVGWAGGAADLPIALVIDRRMAPTIDLLPA